MHASSLRTRTSVLALLVTASLMVAPMALAGSSADPEISDAKGDIDPLTLSALFSATAEQESVGANLTLFDITKAYVTGESATAFHIMVEAVDLDGGLEHEATGDQETPELRADYEARFLVDGQPYTARAHLEPATQEDGTPHFTTNFSLHRGAGNDPAFVAELAGLADVATNTITFSIDKHLVGTPADGKKLTQFYVTSLAQGMPMDYAPDAKMPADLEKLKEGVLAAEAAYGRDYTFGQYETIRKSSFTLTNTGSNTLSAATDNTEIAVFKIENGADFPERIQITHQGAGSGWVVKASPGLAVVGSGSSKTIQIEVTPTDDAPGTSVLTIRATSLEGDLTRETALTLKHTGPAPGGNGGGGGGTGSGSGTSAENGGSGSTTGGDDSTGGGDAPAQDLGADGSEESPGMGMLAVVLGTLGLLGLARRRQSG